MWQVRSGWIAKTMNKDTEKIKREVAAQQLFEISKNMYGSGFPYKTWEDALADKGEDALQNLIYAYADWHLAAVSEAKIDELESTLWLVGKEVKSKTLKMIEGRLCRLKSNENKI